jgi:hypothetical protein
VNLAWQPLDQTLVSISGDFRARQQRWRASHSPPYFE